MAWMVVLFLMGLYGAYKYFETRHMSDPNDFNLNVSTELLGVVASTGVTLFFLNKLNEWRDLNNLKERLIGEAGSRSNDIAISAVEWLQRERWLQGRKGLLKGASLVNANLQGAPLSGVCLEGTELLNANLQKAELFGANLKHADLSGARLHDAHLNGATLQGALILGADLKGVKAIGAKMQGAALFWAKNLDDADLTGATMPDDKPYREGDSLERYTDWTDCKFVTTYEKINEIRQGMGLPTVHVTINATYHFPPATGIGGPTGQIFYPRFTQEYLDRHQQPEPSQNQTDK